MQCRITDMRCKEIINICDGSRIGYAEDVDIVLPEGKVCAIIAYGKGRFFGLFRGEEYYIPWDCIKQIGDDMHIFFEGDTDESGIIDGIVLPAPARSSSEKPFQPHPFTIYDIHVQNPLYLPQDLRYGAIFEGVKSIQPIDLIPRQE